MAYPIVFSSDLHGNMKQYNKLLDYAVNENGKSIVIGGDLTPKNIPKNLLIEAQREFIEHEFISLFKKFHEEHPEIGVYIIPGNDDCRANISFLDQNSRGYFTNISERCENIGRYHSICGYSYVPVSIFKLKDWQKFDIHDIDALPEELKILYSLSEQQAYKEGFLSSINKSGKGIFLPFKFTELMRTNDGMYIQHDIERLARRTNPSKTIYVIHCPPYGTSLDMNAYRQHIGSFAIRSFIENEQPYLTLHGHAHNTVKYSGGKFMEKLGTSISASSGNDWKKPDSEKDDEFNDKISLLVFDLYSPDDIERRIL